MGFTATVSQILLMRELLVVFYGNEISLGLFLASWLLWTGIGSRLLGRASPFLDRPCALMAGLQMAITLLLPLTILAVRSSKSLFATVPGEMLGPVPMLLTALVVLCPFCVVAGGMFSVGSRLLLQETATMTASATASVYLLEAAGSGIGGLLASLMLVTHFTSFQIAFLLAWLNLLAAASLVISQLTRRWIASVAIAAVFLFGVFPFAGPALESLSLRVLWRGFDLLTSQNSAYGNLTVVKTESNRTLLENGLVLFTEPDPQTAEETVHYALLQHRDPQSVLLIGGGLNGSAMEALKHLSVEKLDFVELDPRIFQIGQRYFADQTAELYNQPRVHPLATDGRLFLKSSSERFDVIIVNLPEPQTAQLNRFYTIDFFRDAASKLNPGGVLSFQLQGSENYVTPTTAAFLRCVNRSLGEVFPDVVTIPGDTIRFFAARQPGTLTSSPEELLRRLRSRHLETSYVREYYLPFQMAPDRMLELQEQIRPRTDTPVNRDFAPIAYYFDVALWSTQFNQGYRTVFANLARLQFRWILLGMAALLTLGMAAVAVWRRRTLRTTCVAACVGSMGFTLMALEVLLLLGFQAIYGYVYQQLALLVGAVMMGLAFGTWVGLQPSRQERNADFAWLRLAAIQIAAGLSPLLLYAFLLASAKITSQGGLVLVSYLLFPLVGFLCGALGGYQFPLASQIFYSGPINKAQNTGSLYALDLFGACLGAVLLSAYLIPIFGFLQTSVLVFVLNSAMALLAFMAALAKEAVPAQPSPVAFR